MHRTEADNFANKGLELAQKAINSKDPEERAIAKKLAAIHSNIVKIYQLEEALAVKESLRQGGFLLSNARTVFRIIGRNQMLPTKGSSTMFIADLCGFIDSLAAMSKKRLAKLQGPKKPKKPRKKLQRRPRK